MTWRELRPLYEIVRSWGVERVWLAFEGDPTCLARAAVVSEDGAASAQLTVTSTLGKRRWYTVSFDDLRTAMIGAGGEGLLEAASNSEVRLRFHSCRTELRIRCNTEPKGPDLPTSGKPDCEVDLLPDGVRSMAQVARACSTDDTRPTIECVAFEVVEDGAVVAVATDTHRLAHAVVGTTSRKVRAYTAILDRRVARAAVMAARVDREPRLSLHEGTTTVFDVGRYRLTWVSGSCDTYPTWRKVLPGEPTKGRRSAK